MSGARVPGPEFQPLAKRSWTDLGPRVLSAAVLLLLAVAGLVVGSYLFAALVGAMFAGCYREWDRMVTLKPLGLAGGILVGVLALAALSHVAFGPMAALGFIALGAVVAVAVPSGPRGWRLAGVLFYGAVIMAILAIRGDPGWVKGAATDYGLWAGVLLGTVIWATDTGAYFTGRQVGGEKLAPDISPSKTWSGAIGGFGLGTLCGLVLWLIIVPQSPWWIGLALSAAISILGQAGDLTESALKRRFRVKDSGDIIPGHGGLMDRLDSLTFGALFVYCVGALHDKGGDIAMGFLAW